MAAQENHSEVVKFLLANAASQTLATEVGINVALLLKEIRLMGNCSQICFVEIIHNEELRIYISVKYYL